MSDNHVRDDPERLLSRYRETETQIIPILRGPEKGWQMRAIKYLNPMVEPDHEAGQKISQSTWSRALAEEPTWDFLVQKIDALAHAMQSKVADYALPPPVPHDDFREWLKGYASSAWWETVINKDAVMSAATFRSWMAGQASKKEDVLRERAHEWREKLVREIALHDHTRSEHVWMQLCHSNGWGNAEEPARLYRAFQTLLWSYLEQHPAIQSNDPLVMLAQDTGRGRLREEARRIYSVGFEMIFNGFDPRVPDRRHVIWPWSPASRETHDRECEAWLQEALLTDFRYANKARPDRGLVHETEHEENVRWYLHQNWEEWWWRKICVARIHTWDEIKREYVWTAERIVAVQIGANGWREFGPTETDMRFSAEHWDPYWHLIGRGPDRDGEAAYQPGTATRAIWG